MPLQPKHGRALNAAAFAVIAWLFAKAGSACVAGYVVTVVHAPELAFVMGAMAGFCGFVVLSAARALLAEVTALRR